MYDDDAPLRSNEGKQMVAVIILVLILAIFL